MEGDPSKHPTPPIEERPQAVISVSTTFFPDAPHFPDPSDLILVSADRVLFHLHANQVFAPSTNGFAHKWPPQSRSLSPSNMPIILVPESSPVLNLVLHCVYDLPCTRFPSSVEDISNCVATIIKYGLPLAAYASKGGTLYNLVLHKAPTAGIHMYTLAAQHGLEQLAVAISPFLLSFDLAMLTDDLVRRMGAVYLRRLVFLHLGRIAALKRLLSPPSNYHAPDDDCGTEDHNALMNAWGLAVASLTWDPKPDLAPTVIMSALGSLADIVSCPRCKSGIQQTVRSVVAAWVGIKTTI